MIMSGEGWRPGPILRQLGAAFPGGVREGSEEAGGLVGLGSKGARVAEPT